MTTSEPDRPAPAHPTTGGTPRRYGFRFDPAFRLPLALLGVRPATAVVELDADALTVRFGPWRLRTARSNVTGAERAGPYRWWRVVGPHISQVDRGVSFGTSTAAGVCVRFATPVPALLPGSWLRHPGLTVTVTEPDELVRALRAPAPD
ncbi:hypothetical protein U2F26_05165 [Micromonospora sp. 4G57]|uniref:Uncharacterized protein n=1 Tax=Micromonospora sicca TaxID=2202420 RepID=A0ABU5JHN4_9ACTN|nr:MULTISPECIES: hypothetical protein [unclassified Micromonospora]MDZ5442124.1 hypothetical protein [Micromonospora sp. 4G57]MDZ5492071.1 hypothetical protein [Micromonospora sp. 4G53]